jgi:tetratricopeptide (TPR) repeat protein
MFLMNSASRFFLFLILGLFFSSCRDTPNTTERKAGKTGDAAIDALSEQIFKDPKNAQLYYQRAQNFWKKGAQGGYDFAITDMQYALGLDSMNADFHHFLADIYLRSVQSRLSVTTMERCIELHPKRIPSLLKLAETYLIVKQYGQAVYTLDKVFLQDAQNAEAFFLTGIVYREKGEDDRAVRAFQKSADLDANRTDAFIELGNLYMRKNSPLALRYYDNVLGRDSVNTQARMAKAYYLQKNNRLSEAIAIYRQIITSDPHYEDAIYNLGLLYLDTDSTNLAYQHFDLAVAESASFFQAYYYRGIIKEKRGDKAGALKDYEQALVFNSGYEPALAAKKRLGN